MVDAILTEEDLPVKQGEEERLLVGILVVPDCDASSEEEKDTQEKCSVYKLMQESMAMKEPVKLSNGCSSSGSGEDAVYRCQNCSLCYTTAAYLMRHLRRGCKYRPTPIKNAFRCVICDETFCNSGDLSQHKRITHSKTSTSNMTSPLCLSTATATTVGDAQRRKRTSSELEKDQHRVLSCPDCLRDFTSVSHFMRHRRLHGEGESTLLCPDCPQAFTSHARLQQHQRAHAECGYEHICDLCGKDFRQEPQVNLLVSHFLAVHPGVELHSCEQCGMVYGQWQSFAHHLARHSGEQDVYKCYVCNQHFANQSLFSRHLSTHKSNKQKTENKLLGCGVCGKTYVHQGRFFEHQRREHGFVSDFARNAMVGKRTRVACEDEVIEVSAVDCL